jgi:hypothetical protein
MTPASPASNPKLTARQLLAHIRRKGGRVYRMPEVLVFCLTTDREFAEWLIAQGGKPYLPAGVTPAMAHGGYLRAQGGKIEWDIYIHTIPVKGERTVWEMAGKAPEVIDWKVGDETAAVAS